jgi:hypothetical protein
MARSAPIARPGAKLLLALLFADGDEHDFRVGLLLLDAERLFDRVLVERVHDPLDSRLDDSRAFRVHLDRRLGVGNPLDGYQNLHVFTPPDVARAM